jgi:hypothetical protein
LVGRARPALSALKEEGHELLQGYEGGYQGDSGEAQMPYRDDVSAVQATPRPPAQPGEIPLPAAAGLMSPALGGFVSDAELQYFAAQRVRPVPPWLLGVFFAAALTGALVLTVLIARAFR